MAKPLILGSLCAYAFIALVPTYGRAVTRFAVSLWTYGAVSKLREEKNRNFKGILAIAISIAVLAGTFFMHPLGLCIGGLYFLGSDLIDLVGKLRDGEIKETMNALPSIALELLFLGTYYIGSFEFFALFMLSFAAREGFELINDLRNGNWSGATFEFVLSLTLVLLFIKLKGTYSPATQTGDWFKTQIEIVANKWKSFGIRWPSVL